MGAARDADLGDGSGGADELPVSDDSSNDLEKGAEPGKIEHSDAKHEQTIHEADLSKSAIVDWDGPNDPEFPQNLYEHASRTSKLC